MVEGVMFKPIVVKASEKQRSRLRNGHPVRLSPAMDGAGVNILVRPERFDAVSKCFRSGKGTTVSLSGDELAANREMGGEGIFGKQFDRFVKKTIGKKAAKELYKVADKVGKPLVNKALDAASVAAMAYAPSAAPAIQAAKRAAKGYIDRPTAYQENPTKELLKDINPAAMVDTYVKGITGGGRTGRKRMSKKAMKDLMKTHMWDGTQWVPMEKVPITPFENEPMLEGSGILDIAKKVAKSKMGKSLIKKGVDMAAKEAMKRGVPAEIAKPLAAMGSKSLTGGAMCMGGRMLTERSVSGRGSIASFQPVAMRSDPYGANFAMNTQLPPDMVRGGVSFGSGLYLGGRGLYM
jgi:hypothetical protein